MPAALVPLPQSSPHQHRLLWPLRDSAVGTTSSIPISPILRRRPHLGTSAERITRRWWTDAGCSSLRGRAEFGLPFSGGRAMASLPSGCCVLLGGERGSGARGQEPGS